MLSLIKRSQFIKNSSTLITGTVLAQIISIGSSFALTRLYSPEQYGELGIFISFLAFLTIISGLRYEMGIIPSKRNESILLLQLSIILNFITAFSSLIIIVSIKLFTSFDFFGLDSTALLLPLAMLFSGLFQSFNYWNIRQKEFKNLSKRKVLQSSATAISSIGLSFLKTIMEVGLILGQILGHFASSLYLIVFSIKKDRELLKINHFRLLLVLKKHKDYPLKNSLSALLNSLSSQVPIWLISAFFGNVTLGMFALVLKVLSSPMNIVGTSVSQVFFQRSNQEGNNFEGINQLYKKISISLFALIVLPMIIIYFYGDVVFMYIFGSEWSNAGKIASIFAPFYLIRFIVSSQSTLLVSLKKFNIEIIFNLLLLLSQVVSILLGFYYFDDQVVAFFGMSISGMILFLILGLYFYIITKKVEKIS